MIRLMASNLQWAAEAAPRDVSEVGRRELEIPNVVEVRVAMVARRLAMAAHESQVGGFGPFLAIPPNRSRPPFGRSPSAVAGHNPLARHGHPSVDDS